MKNIENMWKENTATIDENITLNTDKLGHSKSTSIKNKLYQIPLEKFIALIISFPYAAFLISLSGEYLNEKAFLYPTLLLLIITLISMAYYIYVLKEYYSIRSGSAIYDTQKRLSKLKMLEKWEVRSLLLIIPLFAVSFLVVMAKYFLQINLYDLLGSWLYWFMLGSFIVALIMTIILSLFPDKKLRESVEELKEFD